MADTKISALTSKATLVGGDVATILDSEAANTNKKTTLTNIKTFTDSDVVKSVNSVTPTAGAVTIDADDIDDTSATNKFVTAGDLTTLFNTSGTNTGDQDLSGLQPKVITTRGDVIIGDASGDASRLAIGTNGQVLTTDGTDVSWGDPTGGMTNPMTTTGDIIYSSEGSGTPARLAIGTEDQVLAVSAGGVPEWVDAASGGGIGEYNGTESLTISGTDALGAGEGTITGLRGIGIGKNFTVSDTNSICIGTDTQATGSLSTNVGYEVITRGTRNVAFGERIDVAAGKIDCAIVASNADINDSRISLIGAGGAVVASGAMGGSGIGYSISIGGSNSLAVGAYSQTARYGETSTAIERAASPNRQYGTVGYLAETTDATPTEIFLGGVSSKRLTMLNTDTAIKFRGQAVAVDYSGNASAGWSFSGMIASHSGTTALVGSPTGTGTPEFNDAGLATAEIALTADDTNDALAVTVTGVAATTIRWAVNIDVLEDINR